MKNEAEMDGLTDEEREKLNVERRIAHLQKIIDNGKKKKNKAPNMSVIDEEGSEASASSNEDKGADIFANGSPINRKKFNETITQPFQGGDKIKEN